MLFPFVTLLPLLRTDAITCQSGYEITRSSLPSVSKERQIAAATCSTAQYGSNPSCLRVEASMKSKLSNVFLNKNYQNNCGKSYLYFCRSSCFLQFESQLVSSVNKTKISLLAD